MPTNPTITLPGAFPIPDASSQLPSLAYLASAITGLGIQNLDRANHSAGTAHFVSAGTSRPSAPSVGEMFYNTSTNILEAWTGSEWLGVFHVAATAPAATTTVPWYDTTLKLVRIWDTIGGLTGWHPVSQDYKLVINRSGSVISTGFVVVRDDVSNLTVRDVTTTTTLKSLAVVGVAVESIAALGTGVIATVEGSADVSILADAVSTWGVIARGDGLCSFSTAGECRTVGPLHESTYVFSDHRVSGTPMGCFAIATGTRDATSSLVPARMLGHVGAGRTYTRNLSAYSPTLLNNTAGTTSALTEVDLATGVADFSHRPIVMAHGTLQSATVGGGGTAKSCSVEVDTDIAAAVPDIKMFHETVVGATDKQQMTVDIVTVDDTTTPTGIGDKFVWRATLDAGMTSITATFRMRGYTY